MKRIIVLFLGLSAFLSANGEVALTYGKKDYKNSKTKVDGKHKEIKILNSSNYGKIALSYCRDRVDRVHPKTKQDLEELDVKKYNLSYKYNLNKKLAFKSSYIKIIDNLAPTDQGKVYGLGINYKIIKGFVSKFDIYRSDYRNFNVNQYDLSFIKAFNLSGVKTKFILGAKQISIDGDKYGNYSFKDKDYLSSMAKVVFDYNKYNLSLASFFGKRVFTVLNDGQKVQHHAMQQDETYILSLSKQFKNIQASLKYSFQNGKELPENQDNVDNTLLAFSLAYKF